MALSPETLCKTPASTGDSESGEVKAVGGNGFRRMGEGLWGSRGEANEFKAAGGVEICRCNARGESDEPLGGKGAGFIAAPAEVVYQIG